MIKRNVIIVAILIAFVVTYLCKSKKLREFFSQFHGYHCPSCHDRSRSMCTYYCENCGFCLNQDGTGKCVPGDARGPYFHKCHRWEHTDPSTKFMWRNPENRNEDMTF